MTGSGDEASPPGHPSDADTPTRVKQELAELVTERDRAESRRRELTEQIRAGLRRAHDLGVPWSELADLVGYSSAETARVQALRPDEDHPPGSVSIREAADRLGVSRQTIYDHIKTGRLTLAVDRPRGRRVYLPEGTTPVP